MPELPDVEIIKRTLEKQVLGKQIREIVIQDMRVIQGTDEKTLNKVARGKKLNTFKRHGKYLFIELNQGNWLTIHFGMTGNLVFVNETNKVVRFERVSFFLSESERLAFEDQRVFGRIGLTLSPEDFIHTNKLGPDSLIVSWEAFYTILHKQGVTIKSALMDQSKISGIGNVYADEILFQAQISPFSIPFELSEKQLHILHEKTGTVLRTAILFNADRHSLPDDFILKHRGEKRAKCPRCNHEISIEKITGRTTCLCQYCQKN
jgi:formamidopyrimidine-DNA glycosylase